MAPRIRRTLAIDEGPSGCGSSRVDPAVFSATDGQVIIDETEPVPRDHYTAYKFEVNREAKVRIDVGVYSGPALDVLLLEPDEFAHYEQRVKGDDSRTVFQLTAFSGQGVCHHSRTGTLKAGRYYLVLDDTAVIGSKPSADTPGPVRVRVSAR